MKYALLIAMSLAALSTAHAKDTAKAKGKKPEVRKPAGTGPSECNTMAVNIATAMLGTMQYYRDESPESHSYFIQLNNHPERYYKLKMSYAPDQKNVCFVQTIAPEHVAGD